MPSFSDRLIEAGAAQGLDLAQLRLCASAVDAYMQSQPLRARQGTEARKELRKRRKALEKELAEATGVPRFVKLLFWAIPKLAPPPWNVVLSAIFFAVEFTINNWLEQGGQ